MEIESILRREDVPDDVKETLKNLQTDITNQAQINQRIRNLIEFSPDAITLTDLEFNIILVNSRAAEAYGAKSKEELIGVNALEFIVPEQRQKAIDNAMKTMFAGEKRFVFEYTLLRADGTTYPAELYVSAIVDSKGNPTSFVGITRDISERKRAEEKLVESERKYRTLVENMNTGIFRVHVNQGIIQCNRAFCDMFGYKSFEEISCTDLSRLYVNPDDRRRFIEELYLKGELYIKEVLMKRKDGSQFWASISSRVSSTREWHDGIIEDITKKKHAEELLKQVKKEEEMFHAMLTHFVRNDLQKIVNSLDYLLLNYEQTKDLKNNDIKEIIGIATRSSDVINTVNKIFEVLQSSFDPKAIGKEISVLEMINLLVAKFDLKTVRFEINHNNLDFKIISHEYIELVIYEITKFLTESCANNGSDVIKVVIDGLCFEDNFCIIIQDFESSPIPTKVCERLVAKITERWEYHGHYIGLSLASVIMSYFKGQLRIHPSVKKGNEFQLWFPQALLRWNC
ncbi:MAG: PAS domain S-box protein [Candidatus Hodarchaeales archaeon]